jgi:hypothetical protein
MAALDPAAAAAAAAAGHAPSTDIHQTPSCEIPSLALAMQQALLVALQPESAAAIAVRALLHKAVKTLTAAKKECSRVSALSPHPLRGNQVGNTRGDAAMEMQRLQVMIVSVVCIVFEV